MRERKEEERETWWSLGFICVYFQGRAGGKGMKCVRFLFTGMIAMRRVAKGSKTGTNNQPHVRYRLCTANRGPEGMFIMTIATLFFMPCMFQGGVNTHIDMRYTFLM